MRIRGSLLVFCVVVAACAPASPPPSTETAPSVLESDASESPALTPVPNGSPPAPSVEAARAEGLVHATEMANEWVAALRSHDFPSAWALLSPSQQTAFGSMQKFVSDETAILHTAKETVVGPSVDEDPRSLADWIASAPGASADKAFLARVGYPELAAVNNGEQLLVIAPDQSGSWRIWIVR